MGVNPVAVGVGAGVATALAVGFGGAKLGDSIAATHPTGSDADKPAARIGFAAAGLGVVAAAGGMFALARGHVTAGAALLGGGFGSMLGAVSAGIAFQARHGVGVDTTVQGVLNGYDDNRNDQLDLTDRGWFHPAELERSETTTHEDSDGDTHTHTTYYSIDRLAFRADRNHDDVATRSELADAVRPYDIDSNGRLQGDELRRFERELGERVIG